MVALSWTLEISDDKSLTQLLTATRACHVGGNQGSYGITQKTII